MSNTVLFDYPIDMDNEATIISNVIQDSENRNYFLRQGNWKVFRQKEYQTVSWAVLECGNDNIDVNYESILLKSKSCPIRFFVTFEFLSSLVSNYPKIPHENFKAHLEKLVTDSIKSNILEKSSSLYSVCINSSSTLSDIEDRLKYFQSMVEQGYSSSRLEFKGMEELIPAYIEEKKLTREKYTTGFSQLDALLTEGFAPKQITTVAGLSSMGKCQKKGTKIMMYDCSFKKVEDIVVDDLLMGPDSKSRKVLSTTKGFGDMYKIHQKRGDDYFVNKDHILSLQKAGCSIRTRIGAERSCRVSIGWKENGEIVNVSVKDALEKSDNFFNKYRGYKATLEFEEKKILLDPYFLGVWLGDGYSSGVTISNPDIEIRTYLKEYANKLNMLYHEDTTKDRPNCPNCRISNGRGSSEENYILNSLRNYNLIENKHVPKEYLYNSKEIRLNLLAGLLDTDGYMTSGIHEISTKYQQLKDDILFLSRSLGFYCTATLEEKRIKSIDFKGMYWRIRICGNNYQIPLKIKRKIAYKHNKKHLPTQTKIEISHDGKYDYYGFELEGDGLYILKDFTVTHNSSFVLSSMKNLSNKRVVTAQFALEMNSMPLIHKLVAFKSGIPVSKIVSDPDLLSTEERQFYDTELERLRRDRFIYLNDKPNQSIKSIREQIMLLQDHLKTGYMVVVIDLFGKIKELQSSDNFARDYEKTVNIIQPMVKELGIHMILVAQIRRDVANRRFNRPNMNDLKNAGALTEVSDIVLGVHRPYYSPELALKTKMLENIANQNNLFGEEEEHNAQAIQEDMNKNIAEIIVLKQRMGENNTLVNFLFNPDTTCFEQISSEYQHNINMSKSDLLTGA